MYEIKLLIQQNLRFLLTILGIALCTILMLFLLSIYRGVSVGSVEYIDSSEADLWVLQKHADNILRSTSILSTATQRKLARVPEIKSCSPVLFLMVSARSPKGAGTLYLTGFDPESNQGGPPKIFEGRTIQADQEIVLDLSYARKYGLKVGDALSINEDTLKVVGLSSGTNMFVIQYGFVSLNQAYTIIGFPNIVSCFLIQLKDGASPIQVMDSITAAIPGIAVFDQEQFLANNIKEMEAGLLPLLFMVAFISGVVLIAILSLILSVHVIERRRDFAIMKAIGAPLWFLPKIIFKQALILAFCGLVLGILLFFPLIELVEYISPEISAIVTGKHLLVVSGGVILISLISSIIPNRKLSNIYPLELFL